MVAVIQSEGLACQQADLVAVEIQLDTLDDGILGGQVVVHQPLRIGHDGRQLVGGGGGICKLLFATGQIVAAAEGGAVLVIVIDAHIAVATVIGDAVIALVVFQRILVVQNGAMQFQHLVHILGLGQLQVVVGIEGSLGKLTQSGYLGFHAEQVGLKGHKQAANDCPQHQQTGHLLELEHPEGLFQQHDGSNIADGAAQTAAQNLGECVVRSVEDDLVKNPAQHQRAAKGKAVFCDGLEKIKGNDITGAFGGAAEVQQQGAEYQCHCRQGV